MAIESAPSKTGTGTCGECKFFDPNNVAGEPHGVKTVDGEEVREGVCRAPFRDIKGALAGLLLGRLTEKSTCKQPEGVFQKKVS